MKTCINGATTMPYTFEQDMNSAGAAGFEGVEIWSAKLNKFLETHSVEEAKALLGPNSGEFGYNNLQAAALCPWSFCFFGDIEGTLVRSAKIQFSPRPKDRDIGDFASENKVFALRYYLPRT